MPDPRSKRLLPLSASERRSPGPTSAMSENDRATVTARYLFASSVLPPSTALYSASGMVRVLPGMLPSIMSAAPNSPQCPRDVSVAGIDFHERGLPALVHEGQRYSDQCSVDGYWMPACPRDGPAGIFGILSAFRVYSNHDGYRQSFGGARFSLIVRGLTQRMRLSMEPALSLVPEARAPPKGCRPTTAPVGLSFT